VSSAAPVRRPDLYTPSRLNREVRALLESGLPLLWVQGEISNLARPASGHMYFSLKDASAQVRCALFRGRGRQLRFEPADGMAVVARGRVSLYEPRGEYQLIVESLEPAGEGALRAEFERLRAKLEKEGLFATEHKRPLPRFPRRIGVVTSPVGAALRDVLTVLRRRFPSVPVRIYPVPVQGDAAAPAIARALALASERADCDLLILTRGGGSLEDLWAFNEEAVVRAVHACAVPLISAVGHEVDVTLSDLAADVRAPTPSAAAELAVPDRHAVSRDLAQGGDRLARHLRRLLGDQFQRLDYVARRLSQVHPGVRLRQHRERLQTLERRIVLARGWEDTRRRESLRALAARLAAANPGRKFGQARERATALEGRLARATRSNLSALSRRLKALARNLSAVSPRATLERGYAIVRLADGTVVRDAGQAPRGTLVETRLARGRLTSRVEESHEDAEEPNP